MSGDQKDVTAAVSAELTKVADGDIRVTRLTGRRSFLRSLGIAFVGATAVVVGQTRAHASDFPKGSSDNDVTTNKDLKNTDSDQNDSKSVDSDQNRLRDVKRSTDSD